MWMNEMFKMKIFTGSHCATVCGKQNHQPFECRIQNHTENPAYKRICICMCAHCISQRETEAIFMPSSFFCNLGKLIFYRNKVV